MAVPSLAFRAFRLLGLVGILVTSSLVSPLANASVSSRQWRIFPSPNPGSVRNKLFAVVAISPKDAWAVGTYTDDASNGPDKTLTEHWDGSAWTLVPSASPLNASNVLEGVVALAPDDVWAVGSALDSFAPGTPDITLIEHWDGSKWSIVPSPNPGAANSALTGVGRIGNSKKLWAVGWYQTTFGAPTHTLVERWNGISWKAVNSPSPPDGGYFLGVSRSGSSNAYWAVGACCNQSGPNQTLIERWSGSSWSISSSPSEGDSFLNGIAPVPGSTHAWAVGYANNPFHALIEHWNGSTWSLVDNPIPPAATDYRLHDVSALSPTNSWAVGVYYAGGPGYKTLTEQWNGKRWPPRGPWRPADRRRAPPPRCALPGRPLGRR